MLPIQIAQARVAFIKGRVNCSLIRRLILTNKGEKEFATMKKHLIEKTQKIFSKIPLKDLKDLKELIRIHIGLIEILKKETHESI